MDVDEDILAFLSLKTKTPVAAVHVEPAVAVDEDIMAFLQLKQVKPAVTTALKPTTPSKSSSIDSLLQLMGAGRVGAASSSKRQTPAATHEAQKVQLRSDLRSGKSTLVFPVLNRDLCLGGY